MLPKRVAFLLWDPNFSWSVPGCYLVLPSTAAKYILLYTIRKLKQFCLLFLVAPRGVTWVLPSVTWSTVYSVYINFFKSPHRIPIERKADDYHVKFLPVTEPDSDHFFFHIETVRNVLDFFRSGFWVLIEGSFKSNANGGLDGGSFFTPPSKSVCSTQRTAIKSTWKDNR